MAAVTTALAIGAGVSAIGGAVASNQAKQAAKGARGDKARAEAKIESLRKSRKKVVNPYETTTDLSKLAQDLSGNLTNPFQQLGVATQAAEIQMEQADIALANTLDTLRATGASAGGAVFVRRVLMQRRPKLSSPWAGVPPASP